MLTPFLVYVSAGAVQTGEFYFVLITNYITSAGNHFSLIRYI